MSKKRKQKRGSQKSSSPPEEAEAADGAEESGKPRTAYDAFRENVEALVIAVILAIIIRHFAVEAFEIPTGSMATTLYGMHAHFECPNCDHEFDSGLQSDSSTGQLKMNFVDGRIVCDEECPDDNCTLELHGWGPQTSLRSESGEVLCQASGRRWTPEPGSFRKTIALESLIRCPLCHLVWRGVVEASNQRGGDKILVNKFAFQVGKPQRFDVIVFGFDQWKNYIKRLIGLPGERIDLIDGDIYVDGEIVRKSEVAPEVQDVLWRKISDSDQLERGLHGKALSNDPRGEQQKLEPWREPGGNTVKAWERLDDGRWSLNNPASKEPAILEYNANRGFDNFVAYNSLLHGGSRIRGDIPNVGDMKVAFSANPTSGRGWIGAEIRDGLWTFRVQIPIGKASSEFPARIERVENEVPGREHGNPLKAAFPEESGKMSSVSPDLFLPFNEVTRIEFEICDDRVALRIDGDDAIPAIPYRSVPDVGDPPPYLANRLPHYVWILGSDVQANIGSVQLYQDIYYTNSLGSNQRFSSIQLEEGQYFALGDNSPSSSDGRAWNYVPEHNLMGRALLVFWPATPWEYRWKFIR